MIFLMYIFGTLSLKLYSLFPSSFFNCIFLIASFTPSICFVVPDIFKSNLFDVPKIAFSLWKSQNNPAPILINSPKFFLIFCKSSYPTSYISSYIGSSSNFIFSFKMSSFFEKIFSGFILFFKQYEHL